MSKRVTLFSRKPIIAVMFKWNSALTVFFCTVFAYVVAIIYESAYLSAFGIEADLIEISPVVIFYSIITLVLIYGVLELYYQFHYYLINEDRVLKEENHIYRRYLCLTLDSAMYLIYTFAFVFLILNVTTNSINFNRVPLAISIFVGLFIIICLAPILSKIREVVVQRSLKAGLIAYFKKHDKEQARIESRKTNKTPIINEKVVYYTLLIIAALYISGTSASAVAHGKRSYFVWSANGKVKSLIVRHYGRDILVKEYDTKKKKFLDGFTLANTDEARSFKEKYTVSAWE